MANDPHPVLWCLIKDDSNPFKVTAPVDIDIDRLKELVWEKGKNGVLSRTDAKDLALYKLKDAVPAEPLDTLPQRVASAEAVKLKNPWATVLHEFPEEPAAASVHIAVKFESDDSPPHKRPRKSKSHPQEPPPTSCLRSDTVSALYHKLNLRRFIEVRGTPASGKTSLAELVGAHIRQQEPATNVIWVQGWPSKPVYEGGPHWKDYLKAMGWDQSEQTVFIFDEAQLSKRDGDLWNNFFKSISSFPQRRAIAFTSYGSPYSHITIAGTPIFIEDAQRVTLRPIQYDDGTASVGLLFTQTEFDDLVTKQYPKNRFDSSFLNNVFDLTGGHVGAFLDFIKIIVEHKSYRTISNITDQPYTWSSFLKEVSPRELVERLENSATRFARGFPPYIKLQNVPISRIFKAVLCEGYVTDGDFTTDGEKGALMECFRNGWLHTDMLRIIDRPNEFGYFFSSSLHRWYVEWKLLDTIPAISFDTPNIMELVVGIIRTFSPRALSTERRIGPGYVQRPPEAQYQDEFYRCCHNVSKGSLVTFPEFGTKRGRVDFYVPSKQWGVELLRDGDRLEQHSGRFSQTGSYRTSLIVSDYIILDCRTTYPMKSHSHLPKLHHVVFADNFRSVRILNNKLELVPSGEFMLLVPS